MFFKIFKLQSDKAVNENMFHGEYSGFSSSVFYILAKKIQFFDIGNVHDHWPGY